MYVLSHMSRIKGYLMRKPHHSRARVSHGLWEQTNERKSDLFD